MTRFYTAPLMTSLALAAAVAVAGPAQTAAASAPSVRYESAGGHNVLVEGTSNIHDWSGTSEDIRGSFETAGQWVTQNGRVRLMPALDHETAEASIRAHIRVESLEGNRRGLASNMHKALEASDHPWISFRFDGEATQSEGEQSSAATLTLTGDLTVAGATRSVELDLVIDELRNDRLRVRVDKPLKMTDFDIDPPTALLGAARAADDVDVSITWIVERSTPQPVQPKAEVPAPYRDAVTAAVESYNAVYEGVRDLDRERVAAGVDSSQNAIEQLEALDAESLDASIRSDWRQQVEALAAAFTAAGEAASGTAVREAIADLGEALGGVLEIAGHNYDHAIARYQYEDLSGQGGRPWLQVSRAGTRPRTPFGTTGDNAPKLDALFAPMNVGRHAEDE